MCVTVELVKMHKTNTYKHIHKVQQRVEKKRVRERVMIFLSSRGSFIFQSLKKAHQSMSLNLPSINPSSNSSSHHECTITHSRETTVSEGIQTNYFLELTHSLSLSLSLSPLTLTLWTFHNRQPDTYFYTQQEYNSIQALSLSLSLSLLLVIYLAFIMPYIGVQRQAQQWHSLIESMIGARLHGEG